jgi:hypothetical protein
VAVVVVVTHQQLQAQMVALVEVVEPLPMRLEDLGIRLVLLHLRETTVVTEALRVSKVVVVVEQQTQEETEVQTPQQPRELEMVATELHLLSLV